MPPLGTLTSAFFASIEDLREAAVESEVRMIACQMTMGLFEFDRKEMIEGVEIAGAATRGHRELEDTEVLVAAFSEPQVAA